MATPDTDAALDSSATDSGAEAILRTNFSDPQQDARTLMQAASLLMEADTEEKVTLALDHNLKLWVAIKTVIQDGQSALDESVKANLRSLSQFVTGTALETGSGPLPLSRMVSLARINMQIAEGLLQGERSVMIARRAYQIWEEEGKPEGRSQEHWLRAELEVQEQTTA